MENLERQKKRPRAPLSLVSAGIVLTVLFIGVLAADYGVWDEGFRESVMIHARGIGEDYQSFVDSVEEIAGTGALVGVSDNTLIMELSVKYTPELEQQIENSTTGFGKVEVLPVNALYRASDFYLFLMGVAGGLASIAVLLFLILKKKRVVWLYPLILGLTLGEALLVQTLLRIPTGLGSISGAVILLFYLLATGSKVILHPPRSNGAKYREIFLQPLGALIAILTVFLAFSQAEILVTALTIVVAGGLFGYLNVSKVIVPSLQRDIEKKVVEYHVST